MEKALSYLQDHGDVAVVFGLLLAVLAIGLATIPAAWFVAVLIFVVLTMPAVLLIEPLVAHLRERKALLAP